MMIKDTKPTKTEVGFIFFCGFLLGIGASLSCMPQEHKEYEPLFSIEAPANAELDEEVKEFMYSISEKYHLYRIKISVEPIE